MTDKPVTATQADEQAVIQYWAGWSPNTIRNVTGEYHPLVLAFARHRTAHAPSQHGDLADTTDLIEHLREGVTSCGLHDDNETEMFDVVDADEAMCEAADALTRQAEQIAKQRQDLAMMTEQVISLRQSPQDTVRRDAVIEECAKVADAEQWPKTHVEASFRDGNGDPDVYNQACRDIAAAIRALGTKDLENTQ